MKRRNIIIAIIAALLIGGGIYLFTKDDNNSSTPANNSQSTNPNTAQTASSGFAPVSNEGQPFTATVSSDGKTVATIKSDGKGNTIYVAGQEEQSLKIVYTKDAYYSCIGDTCYKYSLSSSSQASFNPSDYTYAASKLDSYKNSATSQGQQSCPAGTCDVWSVTVNGATSSIFIDTASKKISQVETTVNGKTTKIVYTYEDVTVEVPTNAKPAPTVQ